MDKLKILYITRKFPPMVGGMENFSYNLYQGLAAHEDVDIDLISLGKSQKHLIWFFPYAFLKTLFTAKKYDIIFVGDAVLCSIGYFVKLIFKNKIVITNVFGLDITFKNKLYQFYLKRFYSKSDKYVSISGETDKLLKDNGDFDSLIITPGVDVGMFSSNDNSDNWETISKKYDISEGDTVLITVGRLVKRKGVEWFVKNVMPKFKNTSIKYLIVGKGENEENIMSAIKSEGLENQVKMLGKISNEDLNSIYKNADIFVMPNIVIENDVEGFGLVAAEASLAGCVVVASGIQGIKDAIIDGKNGFLLETENVKQYVDTILNLVNERQKLNSCSDKFKQYTIDNYSWINICQKYVDLFHLLLDTLKK